jgi:hypothetical protein
MNLQGGVVLGELHAPDGTDRGGHGWNWVTVASGTTYWIEPQDDPMVNTYATVVFFDPQPGGS